MTSVNGMSKQDPNGCICMCVYMQILFRKRKIILLVNTDAPSDAYTNRIILMAAAATCEIHLVSRK